MKIFPTAAVKRIDAYTIEHEPISSIMLMERAAAALTRAILARYPQGPFAIFAGQGNNGGDALAVARMLAVGGHKVDVWLVAPAERLSPDCATNLHSLQAMAAGGLFALTLHFVCGSFTPPQMVPGAVVIDGLFGSGLTRPVEGLYATVIKYINSLPCDVVAIDIPSGLMGEDNSGNNYSNIVKATVTYTLQFPKLSMLFAENAPYVGVFETLDISLSKEAMDNEPTPYYITTLADIKPLLPRRAKHAHKGNFGRALLVAGSEGMAGASVLAARAALRSGVGLLTLCVPHCNNEIVQRSVPEAMTIPSFGEQYISAPPAVDKYTAVAVGPGLGQAPATEDVLLALIDACRVPMVVDADALNILSRNREYLARLPQGSIITPHIGEFTRLAGECCSSYERLQRAMALARENNICIVLKGAYTAVVTPQGTVSFNTTGNAGMATGGSGDTLTGILLALLAQGMDAPSAAQLGVYIHGFAGDIAAARVGKTALIASDIIDSLPTAWSETALY
ncbi:MAG: NAD(P)H-hydrate dehydratase [Bacteroidaceae bacterium]|nr:NAD(P)H-hydrate dehydratase [Bacteroidaceae bacterium]